MNVMLTKHQILFFKLSKSNLESDMMGFKGMIRDVIMFYVGFQLILGGASNFTLGLILIISAVIFTILGFIIAFGSG